MGWPQRRQTWKRRGLKGFTCVTVYVVDKDDVVVILGGLGRRVGVALHSVRLAAAAVAYADHLPDHVFAVLWVLRGPTAGLSCTNNPPSNLNHFTLLATNLKQIHFLRSLHLFHIHLHLCLNTHLERPLALSIGDQTVISSQAKGLRFLLFPAGLSLLGFSRGKCFCTSDWNTPLWRTGAQFSSTSFTVG